MESQPPPTVAAERRLSTRIPVNEKATLLLGHLASVMPCTLLDLSLDGCRLRTESAIRIERGTVELIFRIGGTGFRLGGELQWTARSQEFGVCFAEMSARREAELVEVLGELTAKLAEKQAEQVRLDTAANVAREAVERLSAELAAKSAREAELRAAFNAAAGEAREIKDRLEAAKKGLSAAEKAAAVNATSMGEAIDAAVVIDAPAVAAKPSKETAPAAGGRERRQQRRHSVDSTATVFLVDVRSNVRGRILDVSLSGCRIRSEERFPVGIYRRVEVEFILDGLPFRLPGVVQSIHDRCTVGIRFVDLSDRKREQLTLLMEELEEMTRESEMPG